MSVWIAGIGHGRFLLPPAFADAKVLQASLAQRLGGADEAAKEAEAG